MLCTLRRMLPPSPLLRILNRMITCAGSIRSYFKGNGTNVLKIAPETSIKLALNDYLRHNLQADGAEITPWQRMVCGGLSGAVGQASQGFSLGCCHS